VKFGIDVSVTFSCCEISENRCHENCALLWGVNELLSIFTVWFPCKRSSHVLMIREFYENRRREGRTSLLIVSEIAFKPVLWKYDILKVKNHLATLCNALWSVSFAILRWEYRIIISLFYNLTHGFFSWSGLVFSVFCIVLFFCVRTVLCVLYCLVLLCCSLLFIVLSSYVFDCIYCTLTVPPGVNPIAINKYLSVCIRSQR
jgi:hypothetical protein